MKEFALDHDVIWKAQEQTRLLAVTVFQFVYFLTDKK